ncbi:oleosin 16 kDa-like [Lolium perenne]|uniref:oleosin 16 kDa-like n=1 Tax=Lolium perenne TaxID=4522 RepID=UPI0021F66051|nr:oleosin 16 kDa-like [Lolium perenne]
MAGEQGHHRGGAQGGGYAVGDDYMRAIRGDDYNYGGYGQSQGQGQNQAVAVTLGKGVAAAAAAGSMLFLSALALTGTVVALVIATPVMVIFSPVLVPAAIAVALLTTGFVSSGALGAAAMGVLAWMYRYLSRGSSSPPGSDKVDHTGAKLDSKAHEVKNWAQQRMDQARTQ